MRWIPRPLLLAAVLVASGAATVADADQSAAVRTPPRLRPLTSGPIIAPREGVLGIPVTAASPEDAAGEPSAAAAPAIGSPARLAALPDTASVRLEDGRVLEGLLAVLAPPTPADPEGLRTAAWPGSWTGRTGGVTILAPSEARRRERAGVALLLVRTPADATGAIELDGTRIEVRWRRWDQPYTGRPLPGDDRPRLAAEPRADRPPVDDPLSWWRWVLLADEIGWRPPPPPDSDERTRRVAEHLAARWRMGLARLGEAHPGVASAVRDALTLRLDADRARSAEGENPPAADIRRWNAEDPSTLPPSIAAWRNDPADLERILSRLLDPRVPIGRAAEDLVVWTDAIDPLLAFPAPPDPGQAEAVSLLLGNRDVRPATVRLAWEPAPAAGPARDVATPPRTLVLPPRSLCRVVMPRPTRTRLTGAPDVAGAAAAAAMGAPQPQRVLQVIDRRGRTRRLAWPAAATDLVRPPGTDLVPVPRLTLEAIERGSLSDPAVLAGFQCSARVRRRAGRWEVFIEARRPPGTSGDTVELWTGPLERARVLVVPESGDIQWRLDLPGLAPAEPITPPGPRPEVVRRSWTDRWYARITLPADWIDGDAMTLAVRRRSPHGGDVTVPGPAPAWGGDPGRVRLDLRAWDE
ncbi:MAG: hypothetical protein ACYTEV_07850 [Planctomycetota bacterium]|jgi:hypothetical protein